MAALSMMMAAAAAVAKPHPAVPTRPVPRQTLAAVKPPPAQPARLQDLVTKQELQARLSHYVTQDQLKAALTGLARKDQVYTREEMDQKFATRDDLQRIEDRLRAFPTMAPTAAKSP